MWTEMACCQVNGTAVSAFCGGLLHLSKYDFLNIIKSNILLRFKETLLISIFITLIPGLRDQIVK